MLKAKKTSDPAFSSGTQNRIKRFSLLGDFMHLIYPENCLVCAVELSQKEQQICSLCSSDLRETNFHLFKEPSPMDQLFWGRAEVSGTYAHLFFEKKSSTQRILFQLKYKHNAALGKYFGQIIGKRISTMEIFSSAAILLPVPLHPKKAFIRGYNQSEMIAQGIAETSGIPVDSSIIERSKTGQTQTKKNRFERWENVQSTYRVKSTLKSYKHVVLIDDVITTGSTLEVIIQNLRFHKPDLQISVVTLAIA